MSDRDRKCLDFLSQPRAIDLLIIGSSRVQTLSARLAKTLGYTAYNFGVGSARAEDWYCILQFVLEHNRQPLRRVLLGIDLEAFTVGCDIDQRLVCGMHLHQYLDPGDRIVPADVPMPDERQAVFLILREQALDNYRAFVFDPESGDLIYTAADPMCRAFNARASLQLGDPTTHNGEYKLRMQGFTAFNPKRAGYFTRAVQACLDRGIGITAFLTTAHPVLQEFLLRETPYAVRLAEFRAALRGSRSVGFQFIDCSTPSTFGGSNDDFINPAHLGANNADLLLRHLLGAR